MTSLAFNCQNITWAIKEATKFHHAGTSRSSFKSQKEAGFGNKESLYETLQSTRVPLVASDFEKSRGSDNFDKRIKLVAVSNKNSGENHFIVHIFCLVNSLRVAFSF